MNRVNQTRDRRRRIKRATERDRAALSASDWGWRPRHRSFIRHTELTVERLVVELKGSSRCKRPLGLLTPAERAEFDIDEILRIR